MKRYIFNIKLLTENEYKKWYDLLSEAKRSRIDKLRFDDDKKRSVVGEMLVKKAISEHCGIDAEKIIIATQENGKPYPVDIDIHFNISHCEDYVVCVIDNKPIGIDIEKIRPVNMKIAKRFFNEQEQKYVFGFAPDEEAFEKEADGETLKRFFEVWTAKEAYLKYTGEGICADLKQVAVSEKNTATEIYNEYVISTYTENKLF